MVDYSKLAGMGTTINKTEDVTNDASDPFSERVGLQQNTRQNKFSQEILAYPLNSGINGGISPAGHHIQFSILEQDVGSISFGEVPKVTSENVVTFSSLFDTPRGDINNEFVVSDDGNVFSLVPLAQSKHEALSVEGYGQTASHMLGKKGSAAVRRLQKQTVNIKNQVFKRAPTTRLPAIIKLFMPPTVEVSYDPSYTDSEVGLTAAQAQNIANIFQNKDEDKSKGDLFKDAVNKVLKDQNLISQINLAAIDTIAPGFKAILFARSGKIINNRLELIFSGLNKRSFNYTFKFLPKSYQEAKAVHNIVRRFKFHMLPEIQGDVTTSRTFVTPDVFDIKYMISDGKENEYINKISTCVLENMNVKYGGDRYQTFDPSMAEAGAPEGMKAPPVQTELTLQFKELELVTQNNVLARGF